MQRRTLELAGAGMAAVLLAAGLGVAVLAQTEEPSPGPIEIPERPVGVFPPDDGRQVLVAEIELEFEEGRVVQAEVVSTEAIDSIAPKVFTRQGGPWEVTLETDRELSFFTLNPGLVEIENERDAESPYRWIRLTGDVRWTLVIPLYADGEPFELKGFTVTDTATQELVIDVDL